jgi:hypothetical protein
MDPEEILAAARATLARTEDIQPDRLAALLRKRAPTPDPASVQKAQALTDWEAHQLRVELDAKLAESYRFLTEDLLPEFIAQFHQQLKTELRAEIDEALDQLVADINSHNRAASLGTVTEIKRKLGTVTELKRHAAS